MVGKRLGPYEILRPLGRGAMAEVYVARDHRLGREVALKLLPTEMALDPERRRRFEEEARVVAALNHPNIVILFSVEEVETLPFMTMELVSGRSLTKVLEAGPLRFDRLCALGAQICDGVACAHAAGILHRDLKPDNVMVTDRDRIKILDFGLAKLTEGPAGAAATDPEAATLLREGTSPGMTLGTAPYMSPEQALGRELDGRTDLFAVGVILYQMATGTSPFHDTSLAATFDRLLNRTPEAPSRRNPELPAGFDRLVARALEKDRGRRYQSAEELAADLEALHPREPDRAPAPEATRDRRRASEEGAAAPAAGRPASLVVLPFTDMSPDRDQEYFCHGLAEELINTLGRLRDLRVVARTSAFAIAALGLEVEEIGRRLQVDTVLEGSVRKSGSRLRVTAQLVRTSDSSHLWSKRFDRELEDVLAVEEEIATTLAAQLESELGVSSSGVRVRSSDSLAAHDLYLRGLYAMNRWSGEWMERAIEHFEQAIEADPAYAGAHAALAQCHLWFYSGIGTRPARRTVPVARAAAESALELDPELLDSHLALGLIALYHDWDRLAARRRLERAIELGPSSAAAYLWNAWRLAVLEGEHRQALDMLRRAEELDPLDPQVKTLIGYVHYFLRDLERALEQFRRVAQSEPGFGFAHFGLGDAFTQLGRYREAIAAYEEAIRLDGRSVNHLGVLAHCCGRAGERRRAEELIAELEGRTAEEYVAATFVALAHLGLGELGRAFECLERAFAERDGSLVLAIRSPELDPLRADPRFLALVEKMGLGGRGG